jgi:hypothetical protein
MDSGGLEAVRRSRHNGQVGICPGSSSQNPIKTLERRSGSFKLVRAVSFALIPTLVLLILSCGSKPPSISAVEWRIESRPNPAGGDYESLSAFASIKDDDGIDNISELWVINSQSALAWKLTDLDWVKSSSGSDTWIGASALATPELLALPRGEYRMIAIDAAGQQAELAFSVSGVFPDKHAPFASYANARLSISSLWPETLVLAFDATGTLIASPPAPKGATSLEGALGVDVASRTAMVGVYGYDPALKMGSFGKRIKTR